MPVIYAGSSIRKNVGSLYSTAAYSFKQLGTNYVPAGYSGNCVSVTRDWDGASLGIGFSAGWRDDVTMVDFVTGSGAHPTANGVIEIYDQSGNVLNATNPTVNQRPLAVINGVAVTQNGKPSAYFDGNRFLEASYSTDKFPNICVSMFLVANYTDTGTTRTALAIGSEDGDEHLGMGLHSVGDYNFYYPFEGLSLWAQRPGQSGLILFVARNNYLIAEMSYRSNGKTGGALGGSTPLTYDILSYRNDILSGTIRIGATKIYGSNMLGYISEVIIFNNNIQECFVSETNLRELDIISTYGL